MPPVLTSTPPPRFTDKLVTATGERRASVALQALRTLWFNTGTLCNVTCIGCYIESSPTNDRLVYLGRAEARGYLQEARTLHPELEEIGFTGGEPFMNRDMAAMLRDALEAGYRVLVLTNAMRPMQRFASELLQLQREHGKRITMRVSLDHHTPERHEAVRGTGSWAPALAGLQFLAGTASRSRSPGARRGMRASLRSVPATRRSSSRWAWSSTHSTPRGWYCSPR